MPTRFVAPRMVTIAHSGGAARWRGLPTPEGGLEMDSSLVVAFRAFVMLACLVLVPLAAIFGSAFPDLVRSVLIDRFLPRESQHATGPSGAEAPRFGVAQSGPSQFEHQGEPLQRQAVDPWQSRQSDRDVQQAAAWSATPQTNSQPPAAPLSIAQIPGNASAAPAASEAPLWQGGRGTDWRGGATPTHNSAFNSQPTAPGPGAMSPANVSSPPPTTLAAGLNPAHSDRFSAMEQRLRHSGALYYRLESWGNDPGLYRFYCRMPIAGNVNVTQNFEATDKDALQAMSRVVAQVDQWRTGR